MATRRFIRLFVGCCLLAGVAAGCVDHNYDTSRLDRTVSLGGDSLTLPLGGIPATTVEDLVGERFSDLLILQPDGTYSMHYAADPVDFLFDALKDYDGARPFQRYNNYPISTTFPLFNLPSVAFDASGTADLAGVLPATIPLGTKARGTTINVPRMPEQLLALNAITLAEQSRVKVTFSIPDCLLSEGTVTTSVQVDLSRFFESEVAPGGIVREEVTLTPENHYAATLEIPLRKFVFDADCYDPETHTLLTDVFISFSCSVAVEGPKTTRELYQKVRGVNQLQITAVLLDLACESIEGRYDYKISELHTHVDLSDLTDKALEKLGDPDAVIDFDDPEVILDVVSNISIPTYAAVDFVAYKKGVAVGQMSGIIVDVPIAPPGETVTQQIRLGKTAHSPDDIILDFTPLIRLLPDEIAVDIVGYTYKDIPGEIQIGEVYEAHVTPHVNIPLAFGPELRLTFQDTMAVPDTLGYLMRHNTFVLRGELTNSLPLQLDFGVEMTDSLGVVLTAPVERTLAPEATSTFSIPLTNVAGDRIIDLRQARLTFRVSGTDNNRAVRADDHVQANLQLQIPGGYHHSF